MAGVTLILRPPGHDDEPAVRALHADLLADGFSFLFDADRSWPEVLDQVAREAAGVDLPPGRVRSDFLLGDVDGTVVGRVSIRHELTPHLLDVGGHVGYAVGRAHRRRGHATAMLQQSVRRLAAAGVVRVLVTCDDDNLASAGVIEACGGIREDVRPVSDGTPKRRYWVEAG